MAEEIRNINEWELFEWEDRIINGEQTYTLQEVSTNPGHYRLVPDTVEVIQEGTPLAQGKLNMVNDGINYAHNVIGTMVAEALRQAGIANHDRQVDFEKRFLQGEASITGSGGTGFVSAYPYTLVSLPEGSEHAQTNTPNYDVSLCVTSADDLGKVNLEVYDKASNGFKVRNTGSAQSVTFTWTIINTKIM